MVIVYGIIKFMKHFSRVKPKCSYIGKKEADKPPVHPLVITLLNWTPTYFFDDI